MLARAGMIMVVGVAAVSSVATHGAAAGSPKAGQALAEKWCASCHAVGQENQTAASDAVPTFVSIANRPDISEDGLKAFLAEPHRSAMKGIVLPRLEIADLAAYIVSLKEP